ncbi:MAG: PD40 domain-containing protein [Fidelibacterota bacterium]|nr:MAG: PD40 domain-containing protein [Candidatus Neomarinimicrobiota bacterium]
MIFASQSGRIGWSVKTSAIPLVALFLVCQGCGSRQEEQVVLTEGVELPVRIVPGFYSAAESYFSPDGRRLILNARLIEGEEDYHVYTVNLDGTDKRRINSLGADACAYYFPDNQHLIFTSTRDNRHLPRGDYSDPANYPAGAELYTCRPDGSALRRLTRNELYEAEVSLSPDGEWVLFGRSINGRMDLWRMRPDGSDEIQITDTPDDQEGGAFYMPDSKTILFRAWKIQDQGQRGMPMIIYTINHDGTDLRRITYEEGVNWAPNPAPDGVHFVFVKMLPPHNFEVFLMNMQTGSQTRLTYNDAFDGFPSFSPDGHTISFSSSRDAPEGARRMAIYLMDIQSLLEAAGT